MATRDHDQHGRQGPMRERQPGASRDPERRQDRPAWRPEQQVRQSVQQGWWQGGGLRHRRHPGMDDDGGSPRLRQERTSFGGWGGAGSPQQARRLPKGYVRSDDRLHDDVCQRIARSDIDASEVSVAVRDGHVTLEGTLPERLMKYRLEDLVDRVVGVRDIDNRITIGRGGQAPMSGSASAATSRLRRAGP